jgi:GTP 3',8-cyclase
MPLDKYQWIERKEILSFEELARLARIFINLGVEKIRLTGGEPLLRNNLERLVSLLSPMGARDLCLTTNGFGLPEKAAPLAAAGLRRINISLDSLDPAKFQRITRCDGLVRVLDGIFEARRCGIGPIKINAVIERGVNDDEIVPLAEFARANAFPIRFIEYMDVGNANSWKSEKTVGKREILERIHAHSPIREIGRSQESSTSIDYEFADGSGDIGVIASVTEPFCTGCTRARLTADGMLVTCLFSDHGENLKALLRGGASDEELVRKIQSVWELRTDRYSEERLAAMNSPSGYQPRARRKIEMISLGG